MTNLPETTRALFELQTDFNRRPGLHLTEDQKAVSFGLPIGSEDFDPTRHQVDQIDPESLFAGEIPKVRRVLPYSRMDMSVIVDLYSGSNFLPDFLEPANDAKNWLMIDIAKSITASHVAGDMSEREKIITGQQPVDDLPGDSEIFKVDSSKEAQRRITQIVRSSNLSFLVSDFEGLEIADLPSHDLIAIKVNHPLELQLPANRGLLPFGGTREVNTNNRKELQEVNAELEEHHRTVLSELAARRITAASVVYDPDLQTGYNAGHIDRSLAVAIRNKHKRAF